MKIILIVVLVIFFNATTTFAQFDKDKLLYTMKAEKYKRMKTTGAVLTVAGGILVAVGISKAGNYNANGSQSNTNGNADGAVAFLLGMGGLGAGIPLWIVGAHAERKYLRKLENASIKFNHNYDRSSLSLTYRF